MKNILFIAITALTITSCHESFDERCQREAKEYTEKNCPREVEPGNYLDSTTYNIDTKTYHYWYTLSGRLDTPEAMQQMSAQKANIKNTLKESLINSVDLKSCKDKGIDFVYTYYSKSKGVKVLEIRFTKDDYSAS